MRLPARLPAPPERTASDPPALIADIEAFLEGAIRDLDVEPVRPPGQADRRRVFPSLCVWAGLLVCVLRGFNAQQELWRLLSGRGLWSFPRLAVSDQAVLDRLATDGAAPLQRLLEQISAVLAVRLAPYLPTRLAPFATEVYARDATTLDAVSQRLPATDGSPASVQRRLPGKLAVAFAVCRQQWWRVLYRPDPHENDKVAARALIDAMPAGSPLLFDLGYFAFQWFDDLTAQGLWWVSRLRQQTSYTVCHVWYQQGDTFDGLVWLGAHRADRAAQLVRLVRFRVGAVSYQYLTNVLEPETLSLRQIAALYQRRWDIELAFNLIKTQLGLHLLWSSKDAVILAQVWAVLIIAHPDPSGQALRVEVAGRAGVDVFEVSLPLLIALAPQFAADGHDPVALLVERGRRVGVIRPSRRTENRAPHIPSHLIRPHPRPQPQPHPALCQQDSKDWIFRMSRLLLGADGLIAPGGRQLIIDPIQIAPCSNSRRSSALLSPSSSQ